MTANSQAAELRCSRCGAAFGCNPAGDCWCKEESFRVPMPVSDAATCLCPKCLRAAAAGQKP